MTLNAAKTWFIAYDVRDPRRLRRVHRVLRREGLAVQYSAFCIDASEVQLLKLLAQLEALLDSSRDDLRAYHVPARCAVWCMGRQGWPDGINVSPLEAIRLLGSGLPRELPEDHSAKALSSTVP
jgi:CRISPR-associated protein Cas2